MNELTPHEIAEQVRAMAADLSSVRTTLTQAVEINLRDLTEIARLRAELDRPRPCRSSSHESARADDAERERAATWELLGKVRAASGVPDGGDIVEHVARLCEAARVPSGWAYYESEHVNEVLGRIAELERQLAAAETRLKRQLTAADARFSGLQSKHEAATLEYVADVLTLRDKAADLEEQLVNLFAPFRAEGVLGAHMRLDKATPERVIKHILGRLAADQRELARLRTANATLAAAQCGEGAKKWRAAAAEWAAKFDKAMAELAKRPTPEAVRVLEGQACTAQQLAAEVRSLHAVSHDEAYEVRDLRRKLGAASETVQRLESRLDASLRSDVLDLHRQIAALHIALRLATAG